MMDATELSQRVQSTLRDYTARTALVLESTDCLTIWLHPVDWDEVFCSPGGYHSFNGAGPTGKQFHGIKVATSFEIPQGQPKLKVHWEVQI